MTNTNLNICVLEKRLLKETEAAFYSGLAAKHFKVLCPVQPIILRPGTKLYDKRDLDNWIDGVKTGSEFQSQDIILGKL